jgi:HEAT repeat protein
MNRALLVPSLAACLAAACASDPPPAADRALESAIRERHMTEQQAIERQKAFENVLLTLDKTLDKYAGSLMTDHFDRSRRVGDTLAKYLAEESRRNIGDLLRTAEDAEHPANRAIAVAALGFSQQPEALQPMLNALQSGDPTVENNALLGIGVLQDSRTPPEFLARIVEDGEKPMKTRITASWALMQIQGVVDDREAVLAVWSRLLKLPTNAIDPGIIVHAVRGIGLTREPAHAASIEPLVSHPTPLVRAAAAIALGRLGARASHTSLLALIGPAETNPNVRLCARKALQALAGNADRGYDVDQWRRVFEDGGR